MKTNPRFNIGERVQSSTTVSPLGDREGRVRAISILADSWSYEIDPGGAGFVTCLETELAQVETPATRARAKQATIERHAERARRLADRAEDQNSAVLAAIAQAQGVASIASILAESAVAVEQ